MSTELDFDPPNIGDTVRRVEPLYVLDGAPQYWHRRIENEGDLDIARRNVAARRWCVIKRAEVPDAK